MIVFLIATAILALAGIAIVSSLVPSQRRH